MKDVTLPSGKALKIGLLDLFRIRALAQAKPEFMVEFEQMSEKHQEEKNRPMTEDERMALFEFRVLTVCAHVFEPHPFGITEAEAMAAANPADWNVLESAVAELDREAESRSRPFSRTATDS